DDEPRPAVLRAVVFIPVRRTGARFRAADAWCPIDRGLRTLGDQFLQLFVVDVRVRLSAELRRTFERNPAFVLVGVGALQIGIAPRRSGWDVRLDSLSRGGDRRSRGGRLRGQRRGQRDGDATTEDEVFRDHKADLLVAWTPILQYGSMRTAVGVAGVV